MVLHSRFRLRKSPASVLCPRGVPYLQIKWKFQLSSLIGEGTIERQMNKGGRNINIYMSMLNAFDLA